MIDLDALRKRNIHCPRTIGQASGYIDTLLSHIATLMAELAQANAAGESLANKLATVEAAIDVLTAERDAAREKAIEECADIADGFFCGGCGMDGKSGKAIRVLKEQDNG